MSDVRAVLRRPETYEAIFDIAYLGLATAACLGVAALPLVVVLTLLADPLVAWPTLLVAALPLGAGIAAAFQVFGAAGERGSPAPVRDAWRGVRRHAGRATAVWALLCALLLVVIVDVVAIWATPWAAVIGPVLGMLVLLGVPTALIALAGLIRRPELSLPTLLRASAWLAVRRAPLSVLSLVVLGAWLMVVLAQPVAGVLGAGGFALYVLWTNSSTVWTVNDGAG